QGVLIPSRNRRDLMLGTRLLEAVAQGRFHIHAAERVGDGMELLTGWSFGVLGARGYPPDSVLGRAQATLQEYRRACEATDLRRRPRALRPFQAAAPGSASALTGRHRGDTGVLAPEGIAVPESLRSRRRMPTGLQEPSWSLQGRRVTSCVLRPASGCSCSAASRRSLRWPVHRCCARTACPPEGSRCRSATT
ncbi:MAG: hypothetical protein KF683_20300, partial [Rubrivivax sp.]|nr:hypothetical protein [Rubrivivax sp.]